MSIDPVMTDANTGGSFNRYVYANNNPFKYFDPDGADPKTIAIVAAAHAGEWQSSQVKEYARVQHGFCVMNLCGFGLDFRGLD